MLPALVLSSALRGLGGRKVPAASSALPPGCSSQLFLISAPRGPLSKHSSNDLRPRQLLVACLLTKALKPKTLKKRKKCKYLFSYTLQTNVILFFILFHKTQG